MPASAGMTTWAPSVRQSLRRLVLRVHKLYNLCTDPFERGPESIYYADWVLSPRLLITVMDN